MEFIKLLGFLILTMFEEKNTLRTLWIRDFTIVWKQGLKESGTSLRFYLGYYKSNTYFYGPEEDYDSDYGIITLTCCFKF